MEEFLRNITQNNTEMTPKKEQDSETRSIPENDSMKNLIDDFVESLFLEENLEEIPQEVCDFVSSLFDTEKETSAEFIDTLDNSKSHSKILNKTKKINKNSFRTTNKKNATLACIKIPTKTYQNQKRKEQSARQYNYKNLKTAKKKIIRVSSKNQTENLFNDSDNGESDFTVKSKIETKKEKKQYEEKVRLMKNHITAMKRQQDELSKKILLFKNKEKYLNTKKKEKEESKKIMLQNKIMKQNELETKKKQTELQKNIINKGLQESTQKAKMEKMQKYKQSKLEKKAAEDKYLTLLQESTTKNRNFIAKIKEQRNKNYENQQKKFFGSHLNSMSKESYEENLIKTQQLKDELVDLETEQSKCMESLNKIKEQFNKYNLENDLLLKTDITPHYPKKTVIRIKGNVREPERKNNKLVLKKCYLKK